MAGWGVSWRSLRGFVLALAAFAGVPGGARAQSFDNGGVIALHRAGLGDDAIIAKVQSLPCNYDTSTDQLIALKQAGVGDEVIVAMVKRCAGAPRAQGIAPSSGDPMTAHPPGIYLDRPGGQGHELLMLRPAATPGTKYTGNGSVLFPYQARIIIAQPSAQLVSGTRHPLFWFYFNAADRKVDTFGTAATLAAQSPNEFSLVRFRRDGGNRQFTVGRVKPFVQIAGIDPRNTIRFTATEVGDSIFRVEMAGDLEPGEYAFVLSGEKGFFRVYDFSVSG